MWQDQWSGKTIGNALKNAVERWGDREAMVFENGTLSYRRLEQSSAAMAKAFLHLGIRHGDVVAVWMAGYAEWPPIYYGLARIGGRIAPVNTRYKPHELEYVLNKSKARVLIFKDEPPSKKDYKALLYELCPEIETGLHHPSSHLPHLEQVIAISDNRLPGCVCFSDFAANASDVSDQALEEAEQKVTPDDVALLQFTSGTTADPK